MNGALARFARQYPPMLRTGFVYMTAYRAEVVIWILTTTMPLIMYAMWSSIAKEAPVGRFDEPAFASYFLAILVVRQLSSAYVVWELNESIRSGRLSSLLLRPVHPLIYYSAEHAGAIPFRIAVLVPVCLLAVWLMPGIRFSADPVHWVVFLWTTAAAFLLNFAIQALIGMFALYSQQSLSIQEAWFGLWALLSGYLFPLELLGRLRDIAFWLPFRSMGALPAEVLLGHLTPSELGSALLVQLSWLGLSLVLVWWIWPKAMRRYEAFGS